MKGFLKTFSIFLSIGVHVGFMCSSTSAETLSNIDCLDPENPLLFPQKDFSATFDTSEPPKPPKKNIETPFYMRTSPAQANRTFMMSVVTVSLAPPKPALKIPSRCKEEKNNVD